MTNSLIYDLVNQVYLYGQKEDAAPKDKIFEAESKVIRELAKKGNCVIVGRCSDYILQDNPRCLKVFLSAPMEYRVKRIMERLKLTDRDARLRIQKEDKRRGDNYRYYTGRIWGAAANFDISINTELGVEYVEDTLIRAISK